MKLLALLILVASLPSAAQCVILKRASAGDTFVTGVQFHYVEGDYPQDFKFVMQLRGRHVRHLHKLGGKMVIVEPNYTPADLEAARKQCVVTTSASK
jgi:hypothetical protein